MFNSFKDLVASRPGLDYIAAALSFSAPWTVGPDLAALPEVRLAFYGGLATIAGLILAASTFVAAMVYGSDGSKARQMRLQFTGEVSRNWRAIIGSCITVAVVAIALIPLDEVLGILAISIAFALLALIAVRGLRAWWWLTIMLSLGEYSERFDPIEHGDLVH